MTLFAFHLNRVMSDGKHMVMNVQSQHKSLSSMHLELDRHGMVLGERVTFKWSETERGVMEVVGREEIIIMKSSIFTVSLATEMYQKAVGAQ